MNTICTEASSVRQMLDAAAGWHDIDELVSKMDEAGLFPPEVVLSAIGKAKKTYARRILSQMKDKDGFPLYPSVNVTDANGNKKRVYKQETLFDVEDYKAVIGTHLLGINHERLTFRFLDRYFRLTDVHGEVVCDVIA
ncbi:MAG: hypothetical protein WKF77_19920 [Planctomycetaceae bacterium]